MKRVSKVWGAEVWFCNEPLYCAKELILEPGWKCSLHCHKVKTETFVVMSGHCTLELDGIPARILFPGDKQTILPGQYHRFSLEPEAIQSCSILEVSTHHEDSDSYRLSESGRYDR